MGRDPIVLVTGAGGQVGRALEELLPDARFCTRQDLDVTDAEAVAVACRGSEQVIHLAAMTAVDRCEQEPARAAAVNQAGTAHIAEAARREGARLIYVSTDYVFDGEKEGEYREDDAVRPLNVYGRTKLGGEQAARAVPEHVIVRTSWVFGEGKNFVDTILERARAGAELRVVDDQVARPTSAGAVARALTHLLERDIVGTVHVAGDGTPCSWAELASFVLSSAALEDRIQRVSTETYRSAAGGVIAERPPNSTLSLEKAKSLSIPLLDWRSSVRDHVRGVH